MEKIGKDCENLIYKYKHQLEFSKCMKELKLDDDGCRVDLYIPLNNCTERLVVRYIVQDASKIPNVYGLHVLDRMEKFNPYCIYNQTTHKIISKINISDGQYVN